MAQIFNSPTPKRKRTGVPSPQNTRLLIVGAAVGLALMAFVVIQQLTTAPRVVQVDAGMGWQPAGMIQPGIKTHLRVIDGTWTAWDGTAPYTEGQGSGYICSEAMPAADCAEPFPMAVTGSLIGRIGDTMFVVGKGTAVTNAFGGALELRINDGDAGLYDNNGVLTVEIQPG